MRLEKLLMSVQTSKAESTEPNKQATTTGTRNRSYMETQIKKLIEIESAKNTRKNRVVRALMRGEDLEKNTGG
jgi:hypothetical protein